MQAFILKRDHSLCQEVVQETCCSIQQPLKFCVEGETEQQNNVAAVQMCTICTLHHHKHTRKHAELRRHVGNEESDVSHSDQTEASKRDSVLTW